MIGVSSSSIAEDPPPWFRLECHESVASTSDLCIARAEAGETEGLAVLALRQTAARGSRARAWVEPEGNFACSVLLRPEGRLDQPALWPFIAALAVHDALSVGVPPGSLSLKWPNDVLLCGIKLGGILVERGSGGGRDWLVAGFGANLRAAPVLPDRKAACVADVAEPPAPAALAEHLLRALHRWREVWVERDFAPVRDAWLARAHPVGTRLAVRSRGAQLTGTFAGLDPDGALLLWRDGRTRRVDTGEVLLLEGS